MSGADIRGVIGMVIVGSLVAVGKIPWEPGLGAIVAFVIPGGIARLIGKK